MTTCTVRCGLVMELNVVPLVNENLVPQNKSALANQESFIRLDREKDWCEARHISMWRQQVSKLGKVSQVLSLRIAPIRHMLEKATDSSHSRQDVNVYIGQRHGRVLPSQLCIMCGELRNRYSARVVVAGDVQAEGTTEASEEQSCGCEE